MLIVKITFCNRVLNRKNRVLYRKNKDQKTLGWFLHDGKIDLKLKSSLPENSYKRGVLSNFPKFTGKQGSEIRGLSLNKFAGYRHATL